MLVIEISDSSDNSSKDELRAILREYGGVKNAVNIASAILKKRGTLKFQTVGDLRDMVWEMNPDVSDRVRYQLLVQVFQAFRIFVNEEIENIKKLIESMPQMMPTDNDCLAIMIGFHSLEHDTIKQSVKQLRSKVEFEFLEKGLKPTEAEISENNASRSAQLFAWLMRRKESGHTSVPISQPSNKSSYKNYKL